MNKMKWMVLFMSITMIFSGCASMNNTGKGAAIGGGSGAALGAILGGVIGKGKGCCHRCGYRYCSRCRNRVPLSERRWIKRQQKQKQIEGAQVEQITDNNGLQAVKVTFDSGILFTTGNATLSAAAKSALSKFANNVLNQNRDMDVSIYGYTDNQGWRNSTAEQSRQKNLNLSQERAQSVASYLLNCGVSSNQIKGVQGMGESDPIASNDTAAGREQNRRVEVYMYASEQMIKDAQAASN